MPKELKPCPACHSEELSREYYGGEVWIECLQCGMRGPIFETQIGDETLAEEAWNNLPRAPHITPNDVDCKGCPERREQGLVWTKEPPTVPGWYWLRDFGKETRIAYFAVNPSLFAVGPAREWSGPVPIPEEAA